MGKYLDLQADIFSVFASVAWTAENIKTFPVNYVGVGGAEYIRVDVVASGDSQVNLPYSSAGLIIIDIFTSAGDGPTRASTIADKLDSYLAGKTLKTTSNGSTQFMSSSLVNLGNDKDNPSLSHSKFSIPFTFFGVR
jgi:hypothetical protein